MKKIGFLTIGLACITLSGCGAVNDAINSAIPEIDNLANLNGTKAQAACGSGRALISGNISKSASFADRALEQVDKLKKMRCRQSLDTDIQVAMPAEKAFPASFTLSNITLQITLSDGTGSTARTTSASATFAGPVTYTRVGTTDIYRTTATVEVSNITFSDINFNTARSIITTAPTPNTAQGRLSFDADDTQLPNGTKLTFTFINGKAKVEL